MSLEVKDLLVERNSFVLRADFSLEQGKILVLLGPSGCGKTTLLRSIAGLEMIKQGTITLNNLRIDKLPTEKRHIGFVFQDLALFEQLRVRDNIGYSLSIRNEEKRKREERVISLARNFKIEHLLGRYPYELSGGERQRVAFARAFAADPMLMLLDEPLSSLDAPLRREMRRFIRVQLSRQQLTTIHVTHDVEEALDLGDEIIVMRDGKMISRGIMSDFEKKPGSGWLARFMNLGLVLPIIEISASKESQLLDIMTSEENIFQVSRNLESNIDNALEKAMCLYIPFSAIKIFRKNNNEKTINVKIVRYLTSTPLVSKLVLTLPSMQDYFFELPMPESDFPMPAEGTEIEISIDQSMCQVLPDIPL